MKASAKRRRSKAQVLEDKAAAMDKENAIQEKLNRINELEQRMQQMQAENQLLQQKTQHVQAMFDEGVIKPDGQGGYAPVLDQAEQNQIKQQVSLSKRR